MLHATADPVAAIVEGLAPFRGTGPLSPTLLRRADRPLLLAEIDLDDTSVERVVWDGVEGRWSEPGALEQVVGGTFVDQ